MLQMQYFVARKNPSKRTAVSCHERSEGWRKPPAGHETIMSMVYIIPLPSIHFWGRIHQEHFTQIPLKLPQLDLDECRSTVVGFYG
jgi:hypothetical protein